MSMTNAQNKSVLRSRRSLAIKNSNILQILRWKEHAESIFPEKKKMSSDFFFF